MARQIEIIQATDSDEFKSLVNSFLRNPLLAINKTTYRTDLMPGLVERGDIIQTVPGTVTRYMAIVEYERRVNVGETR